MDTLIFPLLLQVILIALNAIFACAEIAVISLNETKVQILAEEGNRKAKKLKVFTEQPARFLATIQVAITLSGFLGSAYAADNFAGILTEGLTGTGRPPAGAHTEYHLDFSDYRDPVVLYADFR